MTSKVTIKVPKLAFEKKDRLPVVAHIHGGGFAFGGNRDDFGPLVTRGMVSNTIFKFWLYTRHQNELNRLRGVMSINRFKGYSFKGSAKFESQILCLMNGSSLLVFDTFWHSFKYKKWVGNLPNLFIEITSKEWLQSILVIDLVHTAFWLLRKLKPVRSIMEIFNYRIDSQKVLCRK